MEEAAAIGDGDTGAGADGHSSVEVGDRGLNRRGREIPIVSRPS